MSTRSRRRPCIEAPSRPLQGLTLLLWTGGVPVLAFGLASERTGVVSAGAERPGVAVLVGFANAVVVLTRLWRQGR